MKPVWAEGDSTCSSPLPTLMVRRLVGYQRLEAPALAALERVDDLARDYVNFLHPVRHGLLTGRRLRHEGTSP